MKDPAFLFYPGDYLRDTQCLSEKTQVAYDRIMCEHMRNICISQNRFIFFTKSLAEDEIEQLLSVLVKTEDGYQIPWVAESVTKRKNYSENRRQNRLKKEKTYDKHVLTYDEHMENENVIYNKDSKDIGVIGEKEKEETLKTVFDIFRSSYPGTKRGLDTEFDNLKKKHKDWKSIIPELSDKLAYQKRARDSLHTKGAFVPQWQNLKTYINNRTWEEEISTEINNTNARTGKNNGATDIEVAGIISKHFATDAQRV